MAQPLMDSFSGFLLTYVNTARKHDSNYDIAVQILKHYDQLPDMTLDELAELCFVSQPSISRFCKMMGFQTFAEFKEALGLPYQAPFNVERCYPRGLHRVLQNLFDPQGDYLRSLRMNQEQVVSEANLNEIDRLLPVLHDAARVVCFGSHFNWDCSMFLQKRMLLLGRFLEVPYHGNDQTEAASALSAGDLAILISASCNYRSRYGDIWESLMNGKATVALITQNTHSILTNDADFVLSSGVSNQFDNAKLSTLQLIDLIAMKYIDRYSHDIPKE